MTRRSFAALLGAAKLRAQEPVFSAGVEVVNLLAVVRDSKGRFVPDLERGDFTLEDEGRPQKIRYFSRQSELPLTLGLLVDVSVSQSRLIEAERRAAKRFVARVLRPAADLMFVIQFADGVELLRDATASPGALDSGLDLLDRPREPAARPSGAPTLGKGARTGGTALFDAVWLAGEDVLRKRSGRKALVVLSDGCDTASKTSLDAAIDGALRADAVVYTIRFAERDDGPRLPGLGSRPGMPSLEDGRRALETISQHTGGALYETRRSLDEVFDRIGAELRNQYSLGFTPDPRGAPGTLRLIRLACRRPGLTVQTRKGYFA